MKKVRYIRDVQKIRQLSPSEAERLARVAETFSFRANNYYLSLIDWNDPDDPIRRIIVPHRDELDDFGELDASSEKVNYVAPGCQHKYPHTALLLCTEVCGAYCRFCFRKRLFMQDNDEASVDITPGVEYIRRTPAITNVLLTGGDPLFLSTRRIKETLTRLREIPHVRIIRLGSKMPAFNPFRILDDDELIEVLADNSHPDKRIYLMTHFNVARELTDQARQALDRLIRAGVILANQTPILRGINDRAETLAHLMRELSFAGVPPYYFFQCRPTRGNAAYAVPIVEAYRTLERAKTMVSGLAKRARLVMSHATGKVEMVGLKRQHIYLRYHRARDPKDEGRLLICERDDSAFWLDDLREVRSSRRHDQVRSVDDLSPLGLD